MPLSNNQISLFEEKYGIELPPLYKLFISEYNGCSLIKELFVRVLGDGYEQELAIEEIATLQTIEKSWSFVKSYAEALSLLFIASTPGQPFLWVGLQSSNRDKISVIDGDFGITFLADNILIFLETKLYTEGI
jgi:hypothetical protein